MNGAPGRDDTAAIAAYAARYGLDAEAAAADWRFLVEGDREHFRMVADGKAATDAERTPGQAAYERRHGDLRREFPGIAPIAWEEMGGKAQAGWEDVGSDAIDARVAAIVRAADGATGIVAFRDVVSEQEAEELHERWAEYGPETVSLVIVDSVAGLAAHIASPTAGDCDHSAEITRLRTQAEIVNGLIRDVLESLCQRNGLPLDSGVTPGEPAGNYELAGRLGIGHVFGMKPKPALAEPQPTLAELETAMAAALQDLIDEDGPQPAPEPAAAMAALEDIARAAQGSIDASLPTDYDWFVSRAMEGLGCLPEGWPKAERPAPGLADEPELTEHVSIRFPAEMIPMIKRLATAEGMTVSAWIRREVERETARRERPAPELAAAVADPRELRRLVAEILAAIPYPTGDPASLRAIAEWRERAGIEES